MFTSFPRLLRFLICLPLLSGCGQGTYDQLMEQRRQELGTWEEYRSSLGYRVSIPGGGTVTSDVQPSGRQFTGSETKDGAWQSWSLRLEASRNAQGEVDLVTEADKVQEAYQQQGYVLDNRQDVSGNRITGIELDFSKPDGDPISVRIAGVNGGTVRMTIGGPEIDASLKQRFFGSLKFSPVEDTSPRTP